MCHRGNNCSMATRVFSRAQASLWPKLGPAAWHKPSISLPVSVHPAHFTRQRIIPPGCERSMHRFTKGLKEESPSVVWLAAQSSIFQQRQAMCFCMPAPPKWPKLTCPVKRICNPCVPLFADFEQSRSIASTSHITHMRGACTICV